MNQVISILMPVYNGENFLVRSISSLLNQTYTYFKLIIIDDGSNDNSIDVINKFRDRRIKLIKKINGGKNSALNMGLRYVDTPLVSFIDQDDELHKDHLLGLLSKIKKYDSDISICEAIVTKLDFDEAIATNSNLSFKDGHIYSDLVMDNRLLLEKYFKSEIIKNPLWNKLYKIELFNGITFPENYILDDLPVLYKILFKCENAVYFGFKSYYHYVRIGSVSRNPEYNFSYTQQISFISMEKYIFFSERNFFNTSKLDVINNVYMLIALNTAKILTKNILNKLIYKELKFLSEHYESYFSQRKLISPNNMIKMYVIKSLLRQKKVDLLFLKLYLWIKYKLHDKI